MVTRILCIVILFLTFMSCVIPNEPEGPSWEVRLGDIPLLKGDTIFIFEKLEGENVSAGEDSVLTLSKAGRAIFSLDEKLVMNIPAVVVPIVNPNVNPKVVGHLNVANDEVIVNSASIKNGSISVSYHNKTSSIASVVLEIRNLTKEFAFFAQEADSIPPNQWANFTTDLSGWEISSPDGRLDIEAEAFGLFSPSAPSEQININVQLAGTEYSSMNADITALQSFPAVVIEGFYESPGVLEGVLFTEARLLLTIQDLPFNLNPLNVTFQSKKGTEVLSIPVSITAPAHSTTNVELDGDGVKIDGIEISVPPNGTTIVDMISQIPEEFSLTGSMIVEDTNSTIVSGTEFGIMYELTVPFDFTAADGLIEDIKELHIDKDARDAIEDNLIQAELSGEAVNFSPFSGRVSFLVGHDISSITHELFTDSLILPPLNDDGTVADAVSFTIQTVLDGYKIARLLEAHYYKVVLILSVNHGVVREGDYVILKNVYLSGIGKIEL